MAIDTHLQRLIDANAPLWAGEAEIVRTYWDSPIRTRETDLLWLSRQCHKEYWSGFFPPFERLKEKLGEIDRGIGRRQMLDAIKTLYQEFSHYCVFADVYDALRREGEQTLDPDALKLHGDWTENAALRQIRAEHRKTHGRLGMRAYAFTEGGHCALFAEGMKLRGRGGVDDLIAEACAGVYDDEYGHMLKGITGLEQEGLTEADWGLLTELTVEQMKYRISMRNAQFSHPVPEQRIEEILLGRIQPLSFDYERAGLRAAS